MKKVFMSLGIVLLLVSFAFAIEFPAPFDNAKRLALTDPQPENGVYTWSVVDPELPGVQYGVGYSEKLNQISIIRLDTQTLSRIYYRHDRCGFETFIATPFGIQKASSIDLTKDEAIEMAFEFYRHLVSLNLLPSLI